MPRPRLYSVRVDIFEAATDYAYPVVTHVFAGTTREEAWRYHDSHRRSDSFLRGCEDSSRYEQVRCRIRTTEGWTTWRGAGGRPT